jgi:hypothetical protein
MHFHTNFYESFTLAYLISNNMIFTFILVVTFILCIHILPYRQTDLAASASLQGIRGEGPQLHTLRLASTATSACEYPSIIFMCSEG